MGPASSSSRASWASVPPCLVCPLCSLPLTAGAGALRCARRHAFNVAREGYADLLPRRRRRRALGDSAAMLHARRRVLAGGAFEPISDALNDAAATHLSRPVGVPPPAAGHDGEVRCVLDAGCGEGYYLDRLARHTAAGAAGGSADAPAGIAYIGVDVSHHAARLAARRNAELRVVVADVWRRLPCADGSVAVLLDVFAPRNPAEFRRVLAPGGLLLVVIPAPAHLAELRRLLPMLHIQPAKEEHVVRQLGGRFALTDARSFEYAIRLDGPALNDLMQMTPSATHVSPAVVGAHAGTGARVTAMVSVRLLAFRPDGPQDAALDRQLLA